MKKNKYQIFPVGGHPICMPPKTCIWMCPTDWHPNLPSFITTLYPSFYIPKFSETFATTTIKCPKICSCFSYFAYEIPLNPFLYLVLGITRKGIGA